MRGREGDGKRRLLVDVESEYNRESESGEGERAY